jgi:IS30 family transposase
LQFRRQRRHLLTLCERVTRLTLAAPPKNKMAEATGLILRPIFACLPAQARRSITFDNGGEFALHRNLSEHLAMDTWFCDPHSPWQRGAIENTNGVVRPCTSHGSAGI